MSKRVRLLGASLLLTAPLLSGCGLFGGPDLVVYNAQHEELMTEIVPLFEEKTGLDVELRNGKDLELANQLVAEGADSPADVFLTENSPAMNIVDNEGLFAPVSEEATAPIPSEYVPSSGSWTGILARSTVAMLSTCTKPMSWMSCSSPGLPSMRPGAAQSPCLARKIRRASLFFTRIVMPA